MCLGCSGREEGREAPSHSKVWAEVVKVNQFARFFFYTFNEPDWTHPLPDIDQWRHTHTFFDHQPLLSVSILQRSRQKIFPKINNSLQTWLKIKIWRFIIKCVYAQVWGLGKLLRSGQRKFPRSTTQDPEKSAKQKRQRVTWRRRRVDDFCRRKVNFIAIVFPFRTSHPTAAAVQAPPTITIPD